MERCKEKNILCISPDAEKSMIARHLLSIPRRTLFSVFLTFAPNIIITSLALTQSSPKPTLAVIDLTASTGISEEQTERLTDKLMTEIANSGRFTVVERKRIKEVLKEQGLQQTGVCDSVGSVKVGGLLGAQKVVIGNLGKVGEIWAVNVRMIDVETGRIDRPISREFKDKIDGLFDIMTEIGQQLCLSDQEWTIVQKKIADSLALEKSIEKQEEEIKGIKTDLNQRFPQKQNKPIPDKRLKDRPSVEERSRANNSGQSITAIVEAEFVSADVGAREGFEKAKEKARLKAIQQAGINIKENTIWNKSETVRGADSKIVDIFSEFVTVYSNATIIRDSVLERRRIEDVTIGSEPFQRYWVKMEVTLSVDPAGQDPSFYLNTSINKTAFNEGERLEIKVQPSQDCYLTIINMVAENYISVLYPNTYMNMKTNFVRRGEEIQIPSKDDYERGIFFEMAPFEKMESHVEAIFILATKTDVPLVVSKRSSEGSVRINLRDFQKWLSRIPLNQRTMNIEQYIVFAKREE
ncbi:MAG: DUF4384 domain-containing protein [Candidatus Edwardsbacteria bacterium]